MKIAYGTYGMPGVPVWEALPGLAELGYEAVELCIAEGWPGAPALLSAGDRTRLRALLASLRLELPALMLFLNLLAPAGEELRRQETLFRDACALARDLAPEQPPVIVSVLGHSPYSWDEAFPLIVERAAHFGTLAGAEGGRLALEPHIGPLLNTPERTLALMERVHSSSLGINFDISHFAAIGCPRADTIAALVPYALHTHVKDARMVDGKVQFLLPGAGEFDYPAYFREMGAAGWTGCITAEVSAQLFNAPGYDAWSAARFCLDTLRTARGGEGMRR